MQIILSKPRGFCAGVTRAIDMVEGAIALYGPPIYVRHEIVHNQHVVEELRKKGAIFVEDISEIPEGTNVIFSAHGVSENIEKQSVARNLNIIDATCPLVQKVHRQAKKYESEDKTIILIGHRGHPEVEGTSGRVKQKVILVETTEDAQNIKIENVNNLAYITQTTLSLDDTRDIINILRMRFPLIDGPDLEDICYATQNRQNAVSLLSKDIDLLLVIGSKTSSNSNRLRDLGERNQVESYLINSKKDIDSSWFINKNGIGITAGASSPEVLVKEVVEYIQELFPGSNIKEMESIDENIVFHTPKKLRRNSVTE